MNEVLAFAPLILGAIGLGLWSMYLTRHDREKRHHHGPAE